MLPGARLFFIQGTHCVTERPNRYESSTALMNPNCVKSQRKMAPEQAYCLPSRAIAYPAAAPAWFKDASSPRENPTKFHPAPTTLLDLTTDVHA